MAKLKTYDKTQARTKFNATKHTYGQNFSAHDKMQTWTEIDANEGPNFGQICDTRNTKLRTGYETQQVSNYSQKF